MARAGKKSWQNSWQNSWYAPCSAKSSGCVNFTATVQTQLFKPHLVKPLSPETIKARTANSIGAASMCPNEEILSQCNNKINRNLSLPSGAVTNPK
jgi:hypothetical protein